MADPAVWAAVRAWVADHDGVISGEQADRLGLSLSARRSLVASGRWLRPHRGVFVDASASPSPGRALRIALLAAGPDAVVSHGSAAWLWGLIDHPPARAHLILPTSCRPTVPGAICHRSDDPGPRSHQAGLPVTDPVRTLIDLAALATNPERCDPLIDRALHLGLTTVGRLAEATRPGPATRRRGTAVLRRRVERLDGIEGSQLSILETRMSRLFVQLRREHGIPLPRREVPWRAGIYRLDFAWPALMLAVEVDGRAWHGAHQAGWDKARRTRLSADGWWILVFEWHEVVRQPQRTMSLIAAAYIRHAGAGPGKC